MDNPKDMILHVTLKIPQSEFKSLYHIWIRKIDDKADVLRNGLDWYWICTKYAIAVSTYDASEQ